MSIKPYGDNFAPVIPLDDEPVHTEAQQFCFDPTCNCHDDPALVSVANQQYNDGLLTAEEATRTIQGRQV
ncbi:hypothetical protein [Ktedonobacter robiniae]|uniref:Antitoxin VbhA domain-containing protein n=1 Tax=Ktedonobacter robiniae TaxID=2778365 RepID=A0ABQ3UW59_9CHLR|nr:hypothetical protein [Ktedonobacter robiniae]GHO56637.1 hypothetical protein KSB_51120 [Ktedonobacter robiniae]